MKQILTIGYREFILPASANVNALLKALSTAKPAEKRMSGDHYCYIIGGNVDIKVELVEDRFVISPSDRKAIPEKTGGPY